MKGLYRLRQKDEIHASVFVNGRSSVTKKIPRHHRLAVLRALISELAQTHDIRFIHVVVDKLGKPAGTNIYELAWKALIQRFENTMQHRNFPGGNINRTDHGLVLPDDGGGDKLRHLLRKMRVYNPIPNSGAANLPLRFMVDDPCHRDSRHSYFIQSVDVTAYFLQQYLAPNAYIKRQSAGKYFQRLLPVLNLYASPGDPLGVVRL
jgi:hypothetical protein